MRTPVAVSRYNQNFTTVSLLNKNNLHVGSLLTTNIMSGGQNTDFKAMSVAAIKKYLQERGASVNGYLKPGLVEITVAVEKMMLTFRVF